MTYFYSLTLRDAKGDKANVVVPFNESGVAIADIIEGGQDLVGLVDPITECVVESVRVSLNIDLPGTGEKTDPVAGSDVQEGANFGFSAAGTDYRHTIRIPGILEALQSGKSITIVGNDAETFVDAIVDGYATTGDTILPTDSYGNDLDGVITAVKTFRK